MNKNKKDQIRKLTADKAAMVGSVVAIAAFGHNTQPASAQTSSVQTPKSAELDSTYMAQQELNKKAQQDATILAENVAQLASSNPEHTSTTYAKDIQGKEIAIVVVSIPAGIKDGSNKGEYQFTIVAPVKSESDKSLELNGVQEVVVAAGSIEQQSGGLNPYIELGFQLNDANNLWGTGTQILNAEMNSTSPSSTAVDPSSGSNVETMTYDNLAHSFQLATEVLDACEHRQPIKLNYLTTSPNSTSTPVSAGQNGGTPAATPPSYNGGTLAP